MLARRAFAVLGFAVAVCALCAQLGVSASAATRDGQVVSGARIAVVADAIAHGLVNGPDRSIAPAYQLIDQNVPAGTVAIVADGTPQVNPTYVSVPVTIRVDGKTARTVVAGYRVTSYVETAVAARDLVPGTVLAAEDLTVARVPYNGRLAIGDDALVGRVVRSATPKGARIYVEQTVPNDVVKAGQPAVLIVHDGAVALAADVVARTGGAVGDVVTVVNPQTQKALAGVVTGPNRVEMYLPGVQQ